jgi:hypothetical protein
MKLVTFSIAALEQTKGFARVVEAVPPTAAHAVGVTSGVTGIALWAEMAQHLTVLVGLGVAFLALLGGGFYASYWGMKSLQKWRELRQPTQVPVKADGSDD